MPLAGGWCKVWIYFGFVFAWTKGARPRFDTSADMGLVLIPADAEVDSVIFRLRATDQDADFPLVFEITATITPVVRIDNLPCTLYNKVCQANVILTKRLIPGRLHDFAVRVRDTKGDSNSMQATISVTNATTPRDKIFPHIPSLIMVPEDTKPGKELDYLLVRANSWSGKPVYIELWQPKELFTIRQRQTPTQTRGIITLIGELDFETQSMYTLTMYATDPYTEPGKDTRNIAGLNVVVIVQDVQDVPPIFTLAPPLTRINNSVQPGDVVLRVHAEDGDKGVPREIAYGLVSEGNPFTPFFNISETTGEIVLARPLEELTQITHVGAPVVLTVVAEEIRRSREEPPAQATVVDVGFLLGEPGNSPPYFESDNYAVTIDENPEPGTVITFGEQYTTRVRDEDIGKAGVFALKLENNNGTFEINPTVAERTADFIITVRDNTLIDYETHTSLSFKIIAQEVGPATNLSASAPVIVYLRDINDNPPVFDEESYEVTLSENVTAGTRVVQVHATDKDTGILGSIRYTNITGSGSEAFSMDPDTGLITVAMASSLDREIAGKLELSVEARDENGKGNKGVVPLIVNLLDVNDNAPVFEKDLYQFTLNSELTNFTTPAVIKAIDADAEPPNNEVRYEIIHGNYENKFYLNEITGELILRSPITKIRRKKQSAYENFAKKNGKEFVKNEDSVREVNWKSFSNSSLIFLPDDYLNKTVSVTNIKKTVNNRRKRADDDALYTLTARAYDLGVPHLSSVTQIRILSGAAMEARIVMFVVPGEHPDSTRTAETLATITGGRVTVLETRPYVPQNATGTGTTVPRGSKKSIVVARVEQTEAGTPLVDVEKIRETLAANGVGIIGGSGTVTETMITVSGGTHANDAQTTTINKTVTTIYDKEVTVYKAENKLLFWLLIILGLLMLLAIAALIICCICPGCPFYMAPRKRRVHSSETLVIRTDGRPKRHLHRNPPTVVDVIWNGRKQAWSADPTRRNWQFNKRNTKNFGLSSLPGDVAHISGQQNDIQVNIEPLRVREGPAYDPSRRSRMEEQERMYMEDVDARKVGGYDENELDSLQRHELERGSDIQRQSYRQRSETRYVEPEANEEGSVREQHFYREGNAEVLRLVTRGQVDDANVSHHHHHHHHPTTLVVDGKDIILKRFIEDQKSRNELSMQDIEAARSAESHQRPKEVYQQQQEIIIIPERLDLGHRQHVDELGPNVQRLVIEHSDYVSQKVDLKESQIREMIQRQEKQERQEKVGPPVTDKHSMTTKEQLQTGNLQSYSFHDLELARQNALLTRLLLEKESRHVSGVAVDSSYLETQSLPGQVAIATQTDKTASTQTERQVRSRSDNDESDDDSRYRKKLKSKKRYGDGDWKRARTLWMKSPIEEEDGPCFDKRLSILRKKVREVKEGRKISLETDVLKEISDSLDGNGSSYQIDDEDSMQTYEKSTKQTSVKYKILNQEENDSPSSLERRKDKGEMAFGEKVHEATMDSRKMDTTESTSSPEIKRHHDKCARSKMEEKSPRKEMKTKIQKKVEDVVKPSFKILEREITVLTKKLSKLGDKKQESTGSDSTSQEKSEASTSKDSSRQTEQKSSKKMDTSKAPKTTTSSSSKVSLMEQNTLQRKEAAVSKSRQKLKYQQAQIISPGSSEYEEVPEKSRKQSTAHLQDSTKQKQPIATQSHVRTKRQTHADRREHKKPVSQVPDQEHDKRRDTVKSEMKIEKSGKTTSRAPKLGSVSRKGNVDENSGSTSSEVADGKKSSSSQRNSDKKSKPSSENDSSDPGRIKSPAILEKISGKITGYFEKSKKQGVGERVMVKSETEEVKDNKDTIKDEVPPDKVSVKENLMKVIEMPAKEYIQETTNKIIEDVASDIAVVKQDISDDIMETEPKTYAEEDKIAKEFRSAAEAIIVSELKPDEVKYEKLSEAAEEAEKSIDDKLESTKEEELQKDIKSSDEKVKIYSEQELSLNGEKDLNGTRDEVPKEKEEVGRKPADNIADEVKHEASGESEIIPQSDQSRTDKEMDLEKETTDLQKLQTQTLSTDDESDLKGSDKKAESFDYELLSEEMTTVESQESGKMDATPTAISKREEDELPIPKSPEISDKTDGDKTQHETVNAESFKETKDDKDKKDIENQINDNVVKTSPLDADDKIHQQKTADKIDLQEDFKNGTMISPRPESPMFYKTEEKLKTDEEKETEEETKSDTKVDDETPEMGKQRNEEDLIPVKQSELKTEEESEELSKSITASEDKKEVDLTSDIFINETVKMVKKEVEDENKDLYEFLDEERKLEKEELNGKPTENLADKDSIQKEVESKESRDTPKLENSEVSTEDKFEKKLSDDFVENGRTAPITESEQKELEVSEELQDKTSVSDKLPEAQSSKFVDYEILAMVKESGFGEKEEKSEGEDDKATTSAKPQIERQFSDDFLDEQIMSTAEPRESKENGKSGEVEEDKSAISDKEEIKPSDDFLGDKITPLFGGSELQETDKKVSIKDDKILTSAEVAEKIKFPDDDFLADQTLAPEMGKETESTENKVISGEDDKRITSLMPEHQIEFPNESLDDALTLSPKDKELEKSANTEKPDNDIRETEEVTEDKQISTTIYDDRRKSPTKEELFKPADKIEEPASDKKSPGKHFPEEQITLSETAKVITESVQNDEKENEIKMSHETLDNSRISEVQKLPEEAVTIVDETKKVEDVAIAKCEERTETNADETPEETMISEEHPLNKVKAFKVIETKIPESKRDLLDASDNYQKIESSLIPTLIPEMTVKEGPESDRALSPMRPGSRGQLGSGSKESKLESKEASGEERALEQDKSEPLTSRLLSKVEKLAGTLGSVSTEKNVSPEKDIKTHSEEKFFEEGDDIAEEQYADVSLPLFTSIIDTVDDSDESDSSSDISRKTTLTTRPYHTPRHRARSVSEKEDAGMAENAERRNIDEPAILMVELIDDKYEWNLKSDMKGFVDDGNEKEGEQADSSKEMGKEDDNGGTDKSDTALSQSSASHDMESSDKDSKDAEQAEGSKSKSVIEADEKRSISGTNVTDKKSETGKDDVRTATASTSGTQKMVRDTLKVPSGKPKQVERKRSLPRKKSNSDKKSEGGNIQSKETNAPSGGPRVRQQVKAHHPSQRTQKQSEADKMKQKESDQLKPKDAVGQRKSKEAEEKLFQKPVQHFSRRQSVPKSKTEKKSSSSEKSSSPPKTGEVDTSKTQPKYMSWYKKKREEMEKKREELKAADDDEQLPRWLRKSMRNEKTEKDTKKKQEHKTPEMTPRTRRKVKPLVNVESEQLKAIVRQGRKLRKAEGGGNEDPPIQIFASTPPAPMKHHLVQHSEYKYEKVPPPFYLHPPPAPHPSPQLSPERFETQITMECRHSEDDRDPGIAIPLQGGSRLRNQQLLDKKSVFDIAYNEAAPSQLRSDSTTPPS